jgi:putative tryptophan/tyrosine transport system substrate-binding protein
VDRRGFIVAVTGSLLAAPLAAEAQSAGKVYRIGILASYPVRPFIRDPLVTTLRDLGYVEGQNLVLEIRSANDLPERLPALAAELVRLNVDVIVTAGDSEVIAAKHATSTIPIVMAPSGDPVRAGFVSSLARPGGNITGVSFVTPDLSPKLLEVLRDSVPNLSRIAVLWNAANPVKVIDFDETRRAALALRLTVSSIELKALSELETAFTAATRVHHDGLVILVDQLLSPVITPRIAQFALQRRIPSIAGTTGYAASGGLIGYGPTGIFQIAAGQVAKILKGANPADLPIERPTRLELAINLKPAKALGLTIPQSLLQRADQVIE